MLGRNRTGVRAGKVGTGPENRVDMTGRYRAMDRVDIRQVGTGPENKLDTKGRYRSRGLYAKNERSGTEDNGRTKIFRLAGQEKNQSTQMDWLDLGDMGPGVDLHDPRKLQPDCRWADDSLYRKRTDKTGDHFWKVTFKWEVFG